MPESLIDSLPKHLIPLSDAEKKLLSAVEGGKAADFRTGNEEEDKPENSGAWGESRAIRAEFIRWLSTDGQVTKKVHSKGVRVIGAKITGQLDFQSADLPRPLFLIFCAIDDGIVLYDASARSLIFNGSHVGRIFADGLKTRGSLFLRDGFHAKGAVRLLGAEIGGDLSCGNGTFENEKGAALNADGLKTKGDISLNNGFHAKGAVRLLGAEIGGDLSCGNGTFENEKGAALNADGLKTKGGISLNNGFHAKGEVRLLGADIGGDLSCSNGTFENEKGAALNADGLKTKGDISLNDGFHAKGKVRLVNADIGGNLDCSNGTFENEKGVALCAERMNVVGSFFWQTKGRPVGMIDLLHASVGQLTDNMESWPEKGKLRIDGFVYGALAPDNTPKGAKERLGWLRLQPDEPFKPQPYEQLAKALRCMGHEKDAHEVLIAKNQDLRKHGNIGRIGYIRNWVLDITIAYGWKPWKAVFLFIAPLLLIGWGMFWCADVKLRLMQPSKERVFMSEEFKKGGVVPAAYPVFNPLIYSMDTFVPFVDLHQENYWLPDANKEWGGIFRWYLWGHIVMGWVLSTLAAVGLTGLIRKE